MSAQLAVVAAGLVVVAAESLAGWYAASVNLLLPLEDAGSLPAGAIVAIYAVGVLASLPVTFVPMAALFDGESMGRAFALSVRAFAMNVPALALLAGISFALLMIGLATKGVALILALPWIAAASYAAWKDIFGLRERGLRRKSLADGAHSQSGATRSRAARVGLGVDHVDRRPRARAAVRGGTTRRYRATASALPARRPRPCRRCGCAPTRPRC